MCAIRALIELALPMLARHQRCACQRRSSARRVLVRPDWRGSLHGGHFVKLHEVTSFTGAHEVTQRPLAEHYKCHDNDAVTSRMHVCVTFYGFGASYLSFVHIRKDTIS